MKNLAESSEEGHGSKRAVLRMMMMICYTEHKEKLTLLKKIFSGVLVLQDVCWDTDPQS
jgi:hypothetical protein